MIRDTSCACAVAARGAAVAALCVACGASKPPAAADESVARDSSTQGDSTIAPATGALPDGSTPKVEGGAADGAADGGADSAADGAMDAAADVLLPLAAAECPEGYAWMNGRAWAFDAIGRFGGVAASGSTIAWTQTTGDVLTADRMSELADFMQPLVAPPSSDPIMPNGRVALDSSGNLLLAIDASGAGFVVWQRSARGEAWTQSPASAFDQMLAPDAGPGATFSEPAFGSSGDTFFYLLTSPGADAGADEAGADAAVPVPPPVLYESRRNAATGSWGPGVPITNQQLRSLDAAHRRRPTGASSDDRTLFFFDEATQTQRAGWRNDPSSPFIHFEDVPGAPEAAPNTGCSLLYFRSVNPEAGTEGVGTAY